MNNKWICINCGKVHSTIRVFDEKKLRSTDFCSDKCLQKYHENKDVCLTIIHPNLKGYPTYDKNGKKIRMIKEINLWITLKADIKLKIGKDWNWFSKFKKYDSYVSINGKPIPIYEYEIIRHSQELNESQYMTEIK